MKGGRVKRRREHGAGSREGKDGELGKDVTGYGLRVENNGLSHEGKGGDVDG